MNVLESLKQITPRVEFPDVLFVQGTPVVDYKVLESTLYLIADMNYGYPIDFVDLKELLNYCEDYEITSVVDEYSGNEIVEVNYDEHLPNIELRF